MSNLNINNIPRPFSLPGQQQLNNNDDLPQVNDVNAVENQIVLGENIGEQEINETNNSPLQEKPMPATWLKQLNAIMETAAQKVSGIFSFDEMVNAQTENIPPQKSYKKELGKLHENADNALKQLNVLSGRELAKAFEDKKIYAKAEKAISALMDLAKGIKEFMKKNNIQGDLRDMAIRCELRAAEVARLLGDLSDLNADDERLNKTVAELLPAEQLKGNYTNDILQKFQDKMNPLMEHLDQLETQDAPKDLLVFQKLSSEIKTMRAALQDARKNGVDMYGDGKHGRVMPNPVLLKSMEEVLQKADERLAQCRDAFGANSIKKHLEFVFPDIQNCDFVKENQELLKLVCPQWSKFFEESKALHDKLRELADNPKTTPDQFGKLINDFKQKYTNSQDQMMLEKETLAFILTNKDLQNGEYIALDKKTNDSGKQSLVHDHLSEIQSGLQKNFQKLLKKALPDDAPENSDLQNPMLTAIKMVWLQELDSFLQKDLNDFDFHMDPKGLYMEYGLAKAHEILKNRQSVLSSQKVVTNKQILDVFHDRLSFCTYLEAHVNGADPDMIDADLEDRNLAAPPKALGKGGANTVYLCSYRINQDTKEYVFKPEYQAKYGNYNLALGKEAHDNPQTIANLNHASYKCAELLGLGKRITKNNVGTLQGTYGIFMEKANGGTPEEIWRTKQTQKKLDGCLNFKELKNLKKSRFHKIKGQLMQQLNQLQWLDLLTAQGDRHAGNYKIEIDENDNVTVKGIDNDMAFLKWRVGLTKVKFSGKNLTRLNKAFSPDKYKDYCVSDANNHQEVILDFSKMSPNDVPQYRIIIGLQGMKIPDYIDENLKNSFLDLQKRVTQNPNVLHQVLGKNLPPLAIEQLKGRLQEICDMLKDLNSPIKVISSEKWTEKTTQDSMDKKFREQDDAQQKQKENVAYPEQDLFYRVFPYLANN